MLLLAIEAPTVHVLVLASIQCLHLSAPAKLGLIAGRATWLQEQVPTPTVEVPKHGG